MSKKLEVIRGSGNVFRDFGQDDAESKQCKATLAAQIIKELDARGLTLGAAKEMTGIPAKDVFCIRQAKLERFTIGRLMTILGCLDQMAEVRFVC